MLDLSHHAVMALERSTPKPGVPHLGVVQCLSPLCLLHAALCQPPFAIVCGQLLHDALCGGQMPLIGVQLFFAVVGCPLSAALCCVSCPFTCCPSPATMCALWPAAS